MSWDVTLLSAAPLCDDAVRAAVARVAEIDAPPVTTYRTKTSQRMGSIFTALAPRVTSETWVNRGARRALGHALRALAPSHDLIVINHPALYSLLDRDLCDVPWVAHTAHVSSRRLQHERATTTGRRQRWLLARDAQKARADERRAAARYDAMIVVSDEDAALLGAATTIVAPNGVDARAFSPTPVPPGHGVVMTGSLQYGPNIDGATWFATEVHPLVRAKVPDATFAIVGMRPGPEVHALAGQPGVTVHADVASVAPFLEAARVAVVPLRAGTGTRLKALEYMAAGRPVVGTSIGLEGLGIVDGTHALVRDDPEAFADAVIDLLESDTTPSALATAGRRLVEDRFQWSSIGAALAADLNRLLNGV